jgi:guanylate kinase
MQGVQRLKRLTEQGKLQPRFVFIAPPSLEILEQRLKGRGTESWESLQRRIANARAELEYGLQEGNFDVVVINDDLEQAVKDFNDAVRRLYNL